MTLLGSLRQIRQETLHGVKSTPLAIALLGGTLPASGYIRYLTDVYYYAKHSSQVIALAGARSLAANRPLGEYLFKHAAEEVGHEDWAREDLVKLGLPVASLNAGRPSSPCALMIALEYYWATVANPVGLFGWMYVLEALGDDLGHAVAGAISKSDATKFVGMHGDADHHHIQDIEAVLETAVPDARDAADILYVAGLSARLYSEIVQVAIAV
jgi:hypothetical protein